MANLFTNNIDGLIYQCLILFSVAIGPYYKSLSTVNTKKWVGSLIGLVLIIIYVGYNVVHPILSVVIGVLAIKLATVRYCHIASFFLVFGHLLFLRLYVMFGTLEAYCLANIIEMYIVHRVVGVAFEINESWLATTKAKKNEEVVEPHNDQETDADFLEFINPSTMDLFHYSFNYIGIISGPYYTYRTYNDYFYLPFSKYADCFGATVNALKVMPLYIFLDTAFYCYWPLNYITTEEYNNHSFLYRMMYPWGIFAHFRIWNYAYHTLGDIVCTSAGFGAYPVQGRNRVGHGPTVGYLKLKQMSEDEAKGAQYDFSTVQQMDVWGCETAVTLRESLKVWNRPVQYWINLVVYKRFPIKPLRTHAAFFVSVLWHGIQPGYFFCLYFFPFNLMVEDIYYKLYYKDATGMKKKIVGFVMWFLRSHSESYQITAFLLLDFKFIWKFYSSVYHHWYFLWLVLLVLGLMLNHIHEASRPNVEKQEKNVVFRFAKTMNVV